MEEPFERSNAGRAVVNRNAFDEILQALRKASEEGKRKKFRLNMLIKRET